MASIETGVTLQADTLSPVAGGPIRTIGVWTTLNGVQTLVQQQVVSRADGNGVLEENLAPLLQQQINLMKNIIEQLDDLRHMLGKFVEVPVLDHYNHGPATPSLTS